MGEQTFSPFHIFTFRHLSSADEMDHLDPVPFTHHSLRPIGAANDHFIQFDSDTLRRQRKYFEQPDEIDVDWKFARFAIEIYGNHVSIVLFELEK